MPKDGSATRDKILDAAQSLMLERGHASTSIDEVINRAGITKGALFYHFKSKSDLAHAVVKRYADLEHDLMVRYMTQAERLSRDPLQQLLIFVGLFEDFLRGLDEPANGCLFASFVYEEQLFDGEVEQIIADGIIEYRDLITAKLQQIMEARPPLLAVDLPSLADQMMVAFEGGFVVTRALREPAAVADALAHHKAYLELLFAREGELPRSGASSLN